MWAGYLLSSMACYNLFLFVVPDFLLFFMQCRIVKFVNIALERYYPGKVLHYHGSEYEDDISLGCCVM
jgi:hypothetical protein